MKHVIRTILIQIPIHLIWYVRSITDNRISENEYDELKVYRKSFGISSVLVLNKVNMRTKNRHHKEWQKNIEVHHLGKVFPNISFVEETDEAEAPDIKDLIQASVELLKEPPKPESNPKSKIMMIQKQIRVENAKQYFQNSCWAILCASASAGAIGASPVPFSDVALLLPLEVIMMAGICKIFQFNYDSTIVLIFINILGSILFGAGLGLLFSNILKFIPGANIAAMTIDASVAVVTTFAIGLAWAAKMRTLYIEETNFSEICNGEELENLKKEFQKEFNRYRKKSKKELKKELENEIDSLSKSDSDVELSKSYFDEIDKNLQRASENNKSKKILVEELNKKNADLTEICCICFINKADVKIKPCGHQVICQHDYKEFMKGKLGKAPCPICRTEIKTYEIVRIH